MKSHVFGFALLSAIAIVASEPAQAQHGILTRSFVSSSGVDTNPCTIAAPCASFAEAYTKVGANGIIAALDPGKYGPLTGTSAITGPVAINGNGWAAITAPAQGSGITISAGPNDKVTLEGLAIDGAGAGSEGIEFDTGGGLKVLNCSIKNTADNGIFVEAFSPMSLLVSNTYISETSAAGIYIYFNDTGSPASTVFATLDHLMVSDVNAGVSVLAMNPVHVTVTNSEFVVPTGNNAAFAAQGFGSNVYLWVKDVNVSGGGYSAFLKGNTTLYLSHFMEPGLAYSQTGTNNVVCDGTNLTAIVCGSQWSTQ
jgi:hypothetical protein